MGLFSLAKLFGITLRESADDGSDFTNPDADFRRLFLGEDGTLKLKDSAGTVSQATGAAPQFTTIELGHASDTTLARASAGNVTIEGNAIYRAGGTDVPLADGGTGASLTDPNADRILFWDDSAGAVTWLTASTGLTITGTSMTASGSGGAPDCEESFCSADTAIATANTWTDITGATMSLAAGDWAIFGWAAGHDGHASTTYVELAIHNGTTQAASSSTTKPAGAGESFQLVVQTRLTLGGTTTVKLQGASVRGSSSTTFRTTATGGTGGVANTATGIRAIKITSI